MSKSESLTESKQSQMVQDMSSCTLQTYSEKASSQSKSVSVRQSEQQINQLETDLQSSQQLYNLAEGSSCKTAIEKSSVIKQDEQIIVSNNSNNKTEENKVQNIENIKSSSENKIENDTKIEQVAQTQQNENMHKSNSDCGDTNIHTPIKGADDLKSEIKDNTAKMMDSIKNSNSNSMSNNTVTSLIDALTTAPDRPYSPLPTPLVGISLPTIPTTTVTEPKPLISKPKETEKHEVTSGPKLIFDQPKRPVSPIPPIKTYNPPEKPDPPMSLPPETTPYIPPDFKINIEQNAPRIEAFSLADAVATAPDRPFTPVRSVSIERGSLKEAVTVAPDRPYSPFSFGISNESMYNPPTQVPTVPNEILRPIATQISNQMAIEQYKQNYMEQFTESNSKLQTTADISAFKPINRQIPPPVKVQDGSSYTKTSSKMMEQERNSQQYSYESQQAITSSSMEHSAITTTSDITHGYSSVKTAQSYFEQLGKKQSLTHTAGRSKSGLHRPDSIPPYQQNFEMLPSQRGVTPELCSAPAIPQRPVTPSTNSPKKPGEKSQEPKANAPPTIAPPTIVAPNVASIPLKPKVPQIKTPADNIPIHHKNKDAPITFTFQPVVNEPNLRVSPARSRPTTPSLINKPAPIIPYYQMNLVSTEQLAPETYTYKPSSDEGSRTPTPKPRNRSPARRSITPQNMSKTQAPWVKETPPCCYRNLEQTVLNHTLGPRTQYYNSCVNTSSNLQSENQNQFSAVKEARHSNVGYQSQSYKNQDTRVKEDSMCYQNYGQRQAQSQNIAEYGNTTVQRTRKTFEEFERTQSAKVIEIRKGGSQSSNQHQEQSDSNVPLSTINPKSNFPNAVVANMAIPPQNKCFNTTNANVATSVTRSDIDQPSPSVSGANQGPVCDPTPSTGSGVGVAARGKNYGVSSAPKRGRGVLNKAALPGSRVPLCGSCNGNIRGPFITALGRIWCPEHFICVNTTCRRPLQDIGFVEENGQLYCEFCFEQFIAPACDKCHAKIKGDCLNAIGKHYHPECFNCVYCGKMFGNNTFFLEDGLPYCEADWNELFTTKCFACGFPVEAGDRWVEALNNNYHSQCFNCTVCKKNLEGQSFFAKGGRPFCKAHAR